MIYEVFEEEQKVRRVGRIRVNECECNRGGVIRCTVNVICLTGKMKVKEGIEM